MKNKRILTIAAAAAAILALTSCGDAAECPPLNTGYQQNVILPSPTPLSASERNYLQELRDEYDQHKNDI